MAKSKTPVELATEFVSESIENAKAAFGGEDVTKEGVEALNKSASFYQSRFADLQLKGMEYAEANTKAAFAFWREAVSAKSPEALFSLQQSFLKSQSEAVARQFKDMNTLTLSLVRDAAVPMQDSMAKAFAPFQPKKAA